MKLLFLVAVPFLCYKNYFSARLEPKVLMPEEKTISSILKSRGLSFFNRPAFISEIAKKHLSKQEIIRSVEKVEKELITELSNNLSAGRMQEVIPHFFLQKQFLVKALTEEKN